MIFRNLTPAGLLPLLCAVACGSSSGGPVSRPGPSAARAAAESGSGAAAVGSGQTSAGAYAPPSAAGSDAPFILATPVPPAGSAAAGGAAAGDVCKGTNAATEPVPVDVFMMIDQSISMIAPDASGRSRWDSVIGALTQFVQAKESAGLGIGLQYFGLGLAGASCEPMDYASAEVEIGPLPDNAMALTASFAQHGPSSVTPTPPALQGAILHAQAYKQAHPSHVVTVLLVTDGEPDDCGLIPETVAAATQGVMGNPAIQTYVLGVGESLDALNQIAAAGGSDHAYIVDAATDVSAQIVMALDKIRNSVALPCEYVIPPPDPGSTFELDKVNLTYTPAGGAGMIVGYSADPAACDAAPLAWRYDDPRAPSKFVLCAGACKAASGGAGRIDIALKCPTIELK